MDFIEQQIKDTIRKILTGRVNELLGEMDFSIPLIELGDYRSGSVVVPVITLVSSERTEKERIINIDAYSLTVAFAFPESSESELHCYAYAAAVVKTLEENSTLGGIADRTVITGKKYNQPKKPQYGEGWELAISLRITIEGYNNAG
jgi:hypothetical protein